MEIRRDACPRLARKAVLRRDRVEGVFVLLYPERGLRLNEVGAAIAQLCDGAHSVDAMIAELEATFPDASAGTIAADVVTFLGRLAERGLLTGLGA